MSDKKTVRLKGKDRTFIFAGNARVTVPRAQRLTVREDGGRELIDAYGKRHVISKGYLAWVE